MRRSVQSAVFTVSLFATPILLSAACTTGPQAAPLSSTNASGGAFNAIVQHPQVDLCRAVRAGGRRCHAKKRTDVTPGPAPAGGFTPSDLISAYNLPSTGGQGLLVALVDAQDDTTAESDLATYRAQFGLPPCTTANGCFQKVNQNGQASNYPSEDPGWSGEISLDLDMVSAGCPSCRILLVEANSATDDDLGTAVNTAAAMGAVAISNSYGGPEDDTVSGESSSYYNHPGVLITASSGDDGFGAEFPATAQFVLAVGGTSLVQDSSNARGWSESAWNDGSSGCSAFITKPSFQTDNGCSNRTAVDVSAVADPNTGVAVFDTSGGGWNVYGGTSASSPLVAAIFALTGQVGGTNAFPYLHTNAFTDVTSGSNGQCDPSYLCTAGPGYDGPTGIGTPNGAVMAAATGGAPPPPPPTVDAGPPAVDAAPPPPPPPPPPPVDAGSGEDAGNDASADAGTDAGNDSGSGDDGGTCSHPICNQGGTLDPSCDPCANDVCLTDPFCCQVQWDAICVSEVTSVCGESCTPGGGGTCAHSICKSGGDLTSSCDPCASEVCEFDVYCCTVLWDRICVSEVGSICGEACQ